MPPSEGTVWTTARKLTSNFVPLVLASPVLYRSAVVFGESGPSARLVFWIAAFAAALWLSLAFAGMFGNGSMRREMGRRIHIERPFDKTERYFVGFARPSFRSALHPHEDVGFLVLHPEHLEFFGGVHRVLVSRADVTGVRFRPNVHSIAGLGRWVSIDAGMDERPIRLLVENREKATLLGNRVASRRLLRRIAAWKAEGSRAEAQDPSVL